MRFEQLEEALIRLGYNRENTVAGFQNQAVEQMDYREKNLNHTISLRSSYINTNFDYAAVTGSIFKRCKFLECSMVQTDYEFCTFSDCEFESTQKVIASFNNSNFTDTDFHNVQFESCTFTGALFEGCLFDGVKISNSTLENAVFRNCIFRSMDLSNLNMDFIEMENSKMEAVILPFSQIPYMFGCLQYLYSTTDDVYISSAEGKTISLQEYLNHAIPLMSEYWEKTKLEQEEYYFPLSNIYIAKKDHINAFSNLKEGLQIAVLSQDYRMIKFYCKLISSSDMFKAEAFYKFYNLINRFAPQGNLHSPEMRSFMRNIGEIKTILFSSFKAPNLFIRFKTNLKSKQADKMGGIIARLFAISKMEDSFHPNAVELILSENSPLQITAQINGEIDNIILLLPALLTIGGMPMSHINRLTGNLRNDTHSKDTLSSSPFLFQQAAAIAAECACAGVKLAITEYHIANCHRQMPSEAVTYFYDTREETDQWNVNFLPPPME